MLKRVHKRLLIIVYKRICKGKKALKTELKMDPYHTIIVCFCILVLVESK